MLGDEDNTWEECAYRLFIDPSSQERVDIPRELIVTSKYCATSGHKVNHSFGGQNCMFGSYLHPRFGKIPSVVTTTTLKAGDELFACYNYSLTDAPSWYTSLWDSNQ